MQTSQKNYMSLQEFHNDTRSSLKVTIECQIHCKCPNKHIKYTFLYNYSMCLLCAQISTRYDILNYTYVVNHFIFCHLSTPFTYLQML